MSLDAVDATLCVDMVRHAEYGTEFVRGMTFEQFVEDLKTRFAVERVIEIIGEAASRLSEQARREIDAIPWKSVIAQRNVLAHQYGTIDYLRLWEVASHHLQHMTNELGRVLADRTFEEERTE